MRRLTGGGAIWHHHELTYALAVPESTLWLGRALLYRAVHEAIVRGFVDFGIRAVRRGEVFPPAGCERSRPLLCFTDRSAEDIVLDGTKIVVVRSAGAGGQSSSMDPFCSNDRVRHRSCQVSAMSRMSRPIPSNGQEGWSNGSRKAVAKCTRRPIHLRTQFGCARASESPAGTVNPAWTEIR